MDGRVVTLKPGMSLAETTIPGLRSAQPGGAVAEVAAHPLDSSALALHNLSSSTWQACMPHGRQVDVPPGKNLRLKDGIEIRFGTTRATVASVVPASEKAARVPEVRPIGRFWAKNPRFLRGALLATAGFVVLLMAGAGTRRVWQETARKWQISSGLETGGRELAAGRLPEARRALEVVQALDPGNAAAVSGLAKVAEAEWLRKEEQRRQDEARREREQQRLAQERRDRERREEEERKLEERRRVEEMARRQAAANAFNGVWVAEGPSLGFLTPKEDPDDSPRQKKVVLGTWRAEIVITGGSTAQLTKETNWRRSAGMGYWRKLPEPYNETPYIYLKYVTEGTLIEAEGTRMKLLWSDWEFKEWRPAEFPREVFEKISHGTGPEGYEMRFERTGEDEITSADWVFKRVRSSP